MQQQITIARSNFAGHGPAHDTIDADVEGHFAVHETVPVELGTWTLTHVPTGYKCLATDVKAQCIAARAEFLASDLDWSFTNPRQLTAQHKAFGKQMKRKYEQQTATRGDGK